VDLAESSSLWAGVKCGDRARSAGECSPAVAEHAREGGQALGQDRSSETRHSEEIPKAIHRDRDSSTEVEAMQRPMGSRALPRALNRHIYVSADASAEARAAKSAGIIRRH